MYLLIIQRICMVELNDYIANQSRMDTAEEMDENTQAIYRNDLLYLFFKILMFVILGCVFYYLLKDQSPSEIVNQMNEKATMVTKIMRNKISSNEIVKA